MNIIHGFSKLTKVEKIQWLKSQLHSSDLDALNIVADLWLKDQNLQKVLDDFSENTISNFSMPYGLAPNFLIDGCIYTVPMVIEESSVVAAASLGSKFWLERGGFHTKILGLTKRGHVHFMWRHSKQELFEIFNQNKETLLKRLSPLCENMIQRGGGIKCLELIDQTDKLKNYYQLSLECHTCDAMGANFINSLLEESARFLNELFHDKIQIIMSILSNYTPDCSVKVWVECPIEKLDHRNLGMSAQGFAEKFCTAVQIANYDVSRAVTHNKGIMNGVDAVVLATGNDFRAVEACAHAFAARNGRYQSLSEAVIKNDTFYFSLTLPLALGTVGGLTSLHPLAKLSLAILKKPDAISLMKIAASVGLAQNFSAVKSLITTGIQKGHMKLHLLNILNQLNASEDEIRNAKKYFQDKVVSFYEVRKFLQTSYERH